MDNLIIKGYGISDIGHNRLVNEDYYNIKSFYNNEKLGIFSLEDYIKFIDMQKGT